MTQKSWKWAVRGRHPSSCQVHSLIIIYVHNWSNVSSGSDMMITDGSAVHSTQPNTQEAEGAAGRTAWLVRLSGAIWVKVGIRFFFPFRRFGSCGSNGNARTLQAFTSTSPCQWLRSSSLATLGIPCQKPLLCMTQTPPEVWRLTRSTEEKKKNRLTPQIHPSFRGDLTLLVRVNAGCCAVSGGNKKQLGELRHGLLEGLTLDLPGWLEDWQAGLGGCWLNGLSAPCLLITPQSGNGLCMASR